MQDPIEYTVLIDPDVMADFHAAVEDIEYMKCHATANGVIQNYMIAVIRGHLERKAIVAYLDRQVEFKKV